MFTFDKVFPKVNGSNRGLYRTRQLLSEETLSLALENGKAEDPTAVLWFIFVALALGTACRSLFTLVNSPVPYTVALLFIGITMGVLNNQFDMGGVGASLDAFVHINPHLLLAVFLPALIFESSFSMEWHTLSKVLTKVLILAGPGVLINMALTAALLHAFPFSWDWNFCLMVGSILAATDPVAVVSILKEVGASKILGHVIEGESLVNDGTAIVVFTLFFEISKGEHKTALDVFVMFLTQPLGAMLIGIVAGQLVILWLKTIFRDHLVQITLTLFACYLTFMVAESVFHVSGVLACVSMGFYISAKGRVFFVGNIEHTMHHFWEVLTYCANTLVFVLTGFIIASEVMNDELELKWSDAGWGFLLYIFLNIIRFIVISILWIPMKWKTGYEMSRSEGFICVWGGLRGAIGLALGLVVLEEDVAFTARDRGLVLILVSCAVVGTLVLNASTSALMLRLSGLLKAEKSQASALAAARRSIHERAMEHYEETLGKTGAQYVGAPDFTAVKQLIPALRPIDDTALEEIEMDVKAEQDAFARVQNKNTLVAEIRRRFLHGVRSEAWKILEEDLCDAVVCSYIMEAGEFAEDDAVGKSLTDLDHLLRMLEPRAWRKMLLAFLESNRFGKNLLQGLRKLRIIEEPWMVMRRRMQALNAFCAVHERTSMRFQSLLLDSDGGGHNENNNEGHDKGHNDKKTKTTTDEKETDNVRTSIDLPDSDHYLTQSSLRSLNQLTTNSSTLTSPSKMPGKIASSKASATGTGTHRGPSRRKVDAVQQLAAETSNSAVVLEHLRIVLKESNEQCERAREELKKLQHSHNHIARALRSEDLARETLEVVSHEIARLTRTGLLKQGEAAILSAEHAQVLRKLLRQPLRPTKTSPGRILSSSPIMDPTVRTGVTSRLLRTRIARETDVIEYSIGDIVCDPSKPLPEDGVLIIGNGVLEIRTVNDLPEDEPLVIGCKSHRAAWALTSFEEMCRDLRTGTFNHRSGIQAIAKAKMFGFIIPRALADTIFGDEKEKACLDSYRRAAIALIVESSLRRALLAVVAQTAWIEGGLRKFSPHRFAARGKFEKVGSGESYTCDDPEKIIVLISGMARVDGVGLVLAPAVLDARCLGIPGGTCSKSQTISGDGELATSHAERFGNLTKANPGMGARKNSLANIFGLGLKQPTSSTSGSQNDRLESMLSGGKIARAASIDLASGDIRPPSRPSSPFLHRRDDDDHNAGDGEDTSARNTGRDAPMLNNNFSGKWTPLGQCKLFVVSCRKKSSISMFENDKSREEANGGTASKVSTQSAMMEKLKTGSSTLHALFQNASFKDKLPSNPDASSEIDNNNNNKKKNLSRAETSPIKSSSYSEEEVTENELGKKEEVLEDRRKSIQVGGLHYGEHGDRHLSRRSHDGGTRVHPHSGMVHSLSDEKLSKNNFDDSDGEDDDYEHPLTQKTVGF